ncbi:hypothetical protein HHI36_015774 [Cryptolaemus montrouzieri]|uniref:Uncharacterized protein n=1 Tax=Cryptolaemus montrouzieri TaxID=559131 RepID=A0ABD2N829_9CUCU
MELSSDNEESLELTIDDVSSKLENEEQVSLKTFMYDKNSNCTFEEVKLNEKLVIFPSNRKKKNGRTLGKKENLLNDINIFVWNLLNLTEENIWITKQVSFIFVTVTKMIMNQKKGKK